MSNVKDEGILFWWTAQDDIGNIYLPLPQTRMCREDSDGHWEGTQNPVYEE